MKINPDTSVTYLTKNNDETLVNSPLDEKNSTLEKNDNNEVKNLRTEITAL